MEDIAIVGMACIFPGAPDLAAYWENIVGKVDATSDPPPEWEAERYFDPGAKSNDRIYCKRGGYLGDLARFDPFELGIMPNSLDGGEPDHHLTLRVAHEALKDAGYSRETIDPERTEVIIGRGTYINRGVTNLFQHGVVVDQTIDILRDLHPDWGEERLREIRARIKAKLPPFSIEQLPSLVPNILAGRIANRLNLMGTNYIVDAACASSLVAVELGIADLMAGKCDMAIVGGVNASLPPPILMIFSQINALSRRQTLRAFDADADGTILGEGLGVVILKRRKDAERDGDRIYANLKGVGTASDGRVQALLAPFVDGQALAIRRAYEAAGVDPATIGLVEAHGTGVPLGDTTEIRSLRKVFGPRHGERASCALGAVKSMIGHTLTAAGMAGLIKAALALYHRVLPPTIGCDRPNPECEIDQTPFYLNTETRPWIHADEAVPRRAAVNAFGFGGINAHAILEDAHPRAAGPDVHLHRAWDSEVFLLRADTRAGLLDAAARLREALRSDPPALVDLARALNCEESNAAPAALCLAIVANDHQDLGKKLDLAAERLRDPECARIRTRDGVYFFAAPLGREGKVALLFPGEGSQYRNMLADLCVHFPELRRCFDVLDRAFRRRNRSYLPSHTVFPLPLDAAGETDRLWQMDSAAESVFAANQALLEVVRGLRIAPHALLGHSTGEYSALLASGVLGIEDDESYIRFVLAVNAVYERLAAQGGIATGVLLAVGAVPRARVAELARASGGVLHVAMENCPNQTILCGSEAAIAAAESTLRGEGAICQRLPFQRAYHTPLFRPVCDALRPLFDELPMRAPNADLYSCVTAARYPADAGASRDLAAIQWASPVRFVDTIEAMHDAGVHVFIEVGPSDRLTAFVDDILRKRPHVAVATNVQRRSGLQQINHLVAQLAAHRVPLDPSFLYAHRTRPTPSNGNGHPAHQPKLTKIETVLPRIRLGADASSLAPTPAPTRASTPTAPRPAQPAIAPSPSPAPAPDLALAPPRAPTPTASTRHTTPAVSTHPTTPATTPADPRTATLTSYLRSMEDLLATTEELSRTYLAHRHRNGPAPSPPPGPTAPTAPAAPTAPPAPFLRELLLNDGHRAIACCTLDLRHDVFLADHTFGGRVSAADPTLLALPILPLTFSMELLCEAGALLAPQQVLTGMREVRTYRWIALDLEQPVTLQISAVHRDGAPPGTTHVQVQVRALGAGDAPDRIRPGLPIVEATVVFAAARPPAPPAPAFELEGRRRSRWTGADLYDGFMFHGPSLRSVASVDAWGTDGMEAMLRAMPEAPLFAPGTGVQFTCDPVVLDGAGQVVAYWTSDHLPRAYHVFPFRLEELQVFGPPLRAPEQGKCLARIALQGDQLVRSDIDVLDPQGRVRFRLLGWWDRRFELPQRFARAIARPRQASFATPCQELLAPGAVAAAACAIDELQGDFLGAHEHLWERVVTHIALHREERAQWSAMDARDRRRREWLLGRVAAKDAVRLLLRGTHGVDLPAADIEIGRDGLGKPWVTRVSGVALDVLPQVSIAHTEGIAVAIAALLPAGAGLGVDVQRISDPASFARASFTPEEQRALGGLDPERAMRAFCAKEAFAKALGTGFQGMPTNVVVRAIDPTGQRLELETGAGLAASHPEVAGARAAVHTVRRGDLVLATCIRNAK